MKIIHLFNRCIAFCCMAMALGAVFAMATPAYAAGTQEMHRLYNRYTGEHFYTASTKERDKLSQIGWTYEGVGWIAPTSSTKPVYRLYNRYVPGGDHHYTTSAEERDVLVAVGWTSEGTGWFSAASSSGQPLYRQYNPYAKTGTHNYTADEKENNFLISKGWKAEGIGWYGVKPGSGSNAGSNGGSGSGANSAGTANVSFNTLGGTKVPAQHIKKGTKVAKPANPIWDGYEFLGWYGSDGKPYDFSKPVQDDQVTIRAKWRQVLKYSYEAYYIDGLGGTWYTGSYRLLYVKTNNPTGDFDITVNEKGGSLNQADLAKNAFVDISGAQTEQGYLKVSGGYVVKIRLNNSKTGRITLSLGEPRSIISSDVQPAPSKQFTVNVRDYDQAEAEWINQQIKRFVNSSGMTPPEKMTAICNGLRREFKYYPIDRKTRQTVSLAAKPTSPYFVSHMWDSMVSPSVVAKIMEKVGFTHVRSCYGDYARDDPAWAYRHYLATGMYDGKWYDFEACPSDDSNLVDLSSVKKISFNNVGQFTRVL